MKKLLSIALIALLALGTLAGCGGGSESASPAPSGAAAPATAAAAATEAATEAAEGPVTLNVMFTGPGTKVDTEKVVEAFNTKLGEFLPDTTANIEFVLASEYEQRLRLALSAGENLDVANLTSGDGSSTNTLMGEVRNGSMMALDDLLATVPELVAEIPEGVWSRARVDGATYMVPINAMITDRFIGLKTQTAFAEQYLDVDGLKELMQTNNGPVTQEIYDKLTEYLKSLSDSGNIQRGVSVETVRWLADRGFYPVNGTTFAARKEETGGVTVVNVWETEEYNLMYKNHRDWYAAGYIEQDIMSMQDRRQYERMEDGVVLSMTTQFMALPDFPMYNSDEQDTTSYGYPVTTIAWNKNYFITPGTSMQGLIIPKTSQNPERAIRFIEALNTNFALSNLLNMGLEGEHWERGEDGNMKKFVEDETQARYVGYGWNYANTLLTDPDNPNGNDWVDYVNYVQNDAVVTPLSGFVFDSEPVKMELSQFDAVLQEYGLSLYSGAMEDWETRRTDMIEKMKTAGSDAILAEIQSQVDAYLAANA